MTKSINQILLVSLSNIGDVVLTFPVLDILRRDFPDAGLTVMAGPKARALLADNPCFTFLSYDKHSSWAEKACSIRKLRRKKIDLAVDLRNTLIPYLAGAKRKTSLFLRRRDNRHMRFQHLDRLRSVYLYSSESSQKFAVDLFGGRVNRLPQEIRRGHYIVAAPGAADHRKRLSPRCFAGLCDHIVERHRKDVVLIGDVSDEEIGEEVLNAMQHKGYNLCGQTTLLESASLMAGAGLVLTNDSAPMHLASYLDIPVIAFFGPTSPVKYGPWSGKSLTVTPQGAGTDVWRPGASLNGISCDAIIERCAAFCQEVLTHGS